MSVLVANFPPLLYDALKAEGFTLPDECADVRLVMPVDGVFQLHYEVNMTTDDLAKFGRAMVKIAVGQAERPKPLTPPFTIEKPTGKIVATKDYEL